MKKLSVAAIKNGTVVDHIATGQALKIIQILNLPNHQNVITVGIHLPSQLMVFKDLIKISDKEINQKEIESFAFLAPQATINIVRDYGVIEKYKIKLPRIVEEIIVCPNPRCISNNERMNSSFIVIRENENIKLRCKYCEKIFMRNEIKKYNY